jgi:hypothetical protein
MYERALVVDPGNDAAVDRYAVSAFLSHDPRLLQAGIAMTSRFLARHAGNSIILNDRALLNHAERKFHEAADDFARVGKATSDPRAFTFAGFDALRSGDARLAAIDFKRALALDAQFVPARHGLARSGRWTRS